VIGWDIIQGFLEVGELLLEKISVLVSNN
jgi:hypothetical protein